MPPFIDLPGNGPLIIYVPPGFAVFAGLLIFLLWSKEKRAKFLWVSSLPTIGLYISYWVLAALNWTDHMLMSIFCIDVGVSVISAVVLFVAIRKDVQSLVPRRALILAFILAIVHPANMNVIILFNGSIPHHVLQTVSSQRLQKLPFLLSFIILIFDAGKVTGDSFGIALLTLSLVLLLWDLVITRLFLELEWQLWPL